MAPRDAQRAGAVAGVSERGEAMTFPIPAALQPFAAQPRWVVWRLEMDGDKPTKRPYQAKAPSVKAKVDRPSTWSDAQTAIEVAEKSGFDGIGICLSDSDLSAFDIDHCRDKQLVT